MNRIVQELPKEGKRTRQGLECISLTWCFFCHDEPLPKWYVPYICDAHLARCGKLAQQFIRINEMVCVRGDAQSGKEGYAGIVTGAWMDEHNVQCYGVQGGNGWQSGDYYRYQLDVFEKPVVATRKRRRLFDG